MEAAGLVQAVHLNDSLQALVIRGNNAPRSSPDRFAANNWASALSVCATNRRYTADFEVLLAACSMRALTGSSPTG